MQVEFSKTKEQKDKGDEVELNMSTNKLILEFAIDKQKNLWNRQTKHWRQSAMIDMLVIWERKLAVKLVLLNSTYLLNAMLKIGTALLTSVFLWLIQNIKKDESTKHIHLYDIEFSANLDSFSNI